jgi:hypothetical protein
MIEAQPRSYWHVNSGVDVATVSSVRANCDTPVVAVNCGTIAGAGQASTCWVLAVYVFVGQLNT